MATTESGLFPPLIDTYMPALNINEISTEGIVVNFSFSDYNNINDLKSIHITIIRQTDYKSLLNASDYPMGIYINDIVSNQPTITIPYSIINKNMLSFNTYYKIQVRLSKDPNPNKTGSDLSEYLTKEENLEKFSEWSTVCLARFIAPPDISITLNNQNGNNPTINTSNITLVGNYIKGSITDTDIPLTTLDDEEYLSSFDIQLFNSNNEEIFHSTEQLINIRNSFNSINYPIPFYFQPGIYSLKINYITANLYQGVKNINFTVNYSQSSWSEQSEVAEMLAIDSVIGKVNISIYPVSEDIIGERNISIRRACTDDNFTVWETIWHKTVNEIRTDTPLSFDDFTIESGTLYSYEITYTNNSGSYTITETNVLSIFDHAFLTGEGTQLCVKFNPNISNYKTNVSDGVVTTIGGKHPYITRNANMYYRSFTLTGTIAYEMDAEHQFTTRSEMYGDYIQIYGSYFVNRYFNQRNDRLTQRKFRELVMNYLYDDVPKLFRSTPEGNILVRITDVTLTPNQQLSRMIYDFSCTATEIADCTINNYKIYKIQDFGD